MSLENGPGYRWLPQDTDFINILQNFPEEVRAEM
jgi:hypothetical protein